MHIVKIRRVSSSNVITLPQQFEASGDSSGVSVIVEQTPSGELLVMPEDPLRNRVRESARRIIAEHREALSLLEAYDRGDATPSYAKEDDARDANGIS